MGNLLYMEEALKEAKKAEKIGEVPVGAIIVRDNIILAKAHNMKETLKDCTAHAEILSIKKASMVLENWRLKDCEMYVTLEPCPMCASAIASSRIKRIYIGTFDPIAGAAGSVINLLQNEYLNYNIDVKWIYSENCSEIITNFFKNKRI